MEPEIKVGQIWDIEDAGWQVVGFEGESDTIRLRTVKGSAFALLDPWSLRQIGKLIEDVPTPKAG